MNVNNSNFTQPNIIFTHSPSVNAEELKKQAFTLCANGDEKALTNLITSHPELATAVKDEISRSTLLHIACQHGFLEIVKLLITHKFEIKLADFNAFSFGFQTPLINPQIH